MGQKSAVQNNVNVSVHSNEGYVHTSDCVHTCSTNCVVSVKIQKYTKFKNIIFPYKMVALVIMLRYIAWVIISGRVDRQTTIRLTSSSDYRLRWSATATQCLRMPDLIQGLSHSVLLSTKQHKLQQPSNYLS